MDLPTLPEILDVIRTQPTVPAWPHTGRALGLTRSQTYRAIGRKEIDAMRFGRVIKVKSVPLRKQLGIDGDGE
jgi:hypothetical protein